MDMYELFTLNEFIIGDFVEVVTKFGLCVVGIIVFNDNKTIRLLNPCKVSSQPIPSSDKSSLQYVTTMLPWRSVGDTNLAQFTSGDISHISVVSQPDYKTMWEINVEEFTNLWYKSGNYKKIKEINVQ